MGMWQAIKNKWSGTAPAAPTEGEQSPVPVAMSPLGRAVRRSVTFDSALSVSAVYACIRLTAETVAALPFDLYQLDEQGQRLGRARDHALARLLRHRPNRHQTRVEFWEQVVLNLCSSGNAYILKGLSAGELVSLTPINSGGVTPVLLDSGRLEYRTFDAAGNPISYAQEQVWHIRLFGNGLIGLSPLALAAQTIAQAQAANDKTSSLLDNGAKPTGVLLTEGWPNADQRQALRSEMQGLVAGGENYLPVLGGKMRFEAISLTPADIELLGTRRFSLEEIGRIFGVPSVLINDTSASTVWGSGIQSLVEGYYKFNLRPYLERIECSVIVNLLPQPDWDRYEAEFSADALLRATPKDRIEANSKQIQSGQATPNEIRISEGRPPIAGGDQLLVPVNLSPIDKIGQTNNQPQGGG